MTSLSSLFGRNREWRDPETGETRAEKAHREQKDRDVIAALKRHGSNLTKPHRLEHHFVASEPEQLEALAQDELASGYEAGEIQSARDEQGSYCYFGLIKPTILTEQEVFAESGRMMILALRYNVDYDGWGCLTEE